MAMFKSNLISQIPTSKWKTCLVGVESSFSVRPKYLYIIQYKFKALQKCWIQYGILVIRQFNLIYHIHDDDS